MKSFYLLLATISFALSSTAQSNINLDNLEFLSGYWVGDGFGGISEEIWTPPNNGTITGIYRHFKDGQLTFSEFIQISSINDTIALRLKHFHPNMIGWETKEDYVTFKLKSVEKNKAIFSGLIYELTDPNHLKIDLTLKRKDGSTFVETFNMTRKQL